ncbi:MAG TPA: alpha/beta family hydrolase [Solirubrobacterales bacterium]|nr:alpha/beta family hydrolase [Solirubrobacterales bacterium]
MTRLEVETPRGAARVHLHLVDDPRAALVLGHGAGGGVEAPDLAAAREAAHAEGLSVALVEQPYRVAGRRSAPAAGQLDAAWTAIVECLRQRELADLPLIVGGRSAGARVACRTVGATGAAAVLCLAFPLQPPPRRSAKTASPSRLPELDAVAVPVLVVQGERDRFGAPPPGPRRTIAVVPGDHGLKSDLEAVGAAIRAWLPGVLPDWCRLLPARCCGLDPSVQPERSRLASGGWTRSAKVRPRGRLTDGGSEGERWPPNGWWIGRERWPA